MYVMRRAPGMNAEKVHRPARSVNAGAWPQLTGLHPIAVDCMVHYCLHTASSVDCWHVVGTNKVTKQILL